ncbi:uncharacterized protein N7459_005165 [Penicillium hispanicum]|uniref:uncharacterized protein n=1 Tax=Penicillium hispanicum TaxID=1080232 RepID=UPI002540C452|nr:uncharacterized protein N7459_005165 [Penicillium hispanicum]KAJ5585365.1 hypothetical protein N7459_005165 [Penicillium hispanicum]
MELTWLADTPQSRGRTRALRACPTCQRRKKRCQHLAPNRDPINVQHQPSRKARGSVPTRSNSGEMDRQLPSSHGSVHQTRTTSADPALQSFSNTERFVGDLNPEALIREKLNEPTSSPLRDRVGLWISSPSKQDRVGSSQRHTTGINNLSTESSSSMLDCHRVLSLLQQRYTSAMQACSRLPTTTRKPLAAIYFAKVNHIIPLLDKDSFCRAQGEGSASVFLERSICLVAAKDPTASIHLRLVEGGPLVTARQFCSDIYKGLVVAMDAELESDRLNRIRALALMSLHCEGYEGAEAASLHLCQAIHQAQTVGLHLDRPDRTPAHPLARLFWGLWTLDKMHASIGGRPVILADRDIGIEKPNVRAEESPGAFRVWLAISDLLATVISYYRPSVEATSGWEEGFPAFEDIVGEDVHGDLDFSTLGVLELYYHSVAILSSRYKPTETSDGTKLSSIRQGLAAVRIHSIVASECVGTLPPLPIVPYAIALSMGVSYRQLRSSKLITHFDRARASLETCCSLLDDLSPHWYSAEAMARLGHKALQQIDSEHQRPPAPEGSSVQPSTSIASTGPEPREVPHTNHQPHQTVPTQDTDTNSDSDMSLMAPIPEMAVGSPLSSMNDLESAMHGVSDIDTLFGDFLDLSLPTNFWDPIFAEEDLGSSQGWK